MCLPTIPSRANRRCRWDELIKCDVHAVCVATGPDTHTCACAESSVTLGHGVHQTFETGTGSVGTTKDWPDSCRDDPGFATRMGYHAVHKGTVCDEQLQSSLTNGSANAVPTVVSACPSSCGICEYHDAVAIEASQFTQASHSSDRYAYVSCPGGCERATIQATIS